MTNTVAHNATVAPELTGPSLTEHLAQRQIDRCPRRQLKGEVYVLTPPQTAPRQDRPLPVRFLTNTAGRGQTSSHSSIQANHPGPATSLSADSILAKPGMSDCQRDRPYYLAETRPIAAPVGTTTPIRQMGAPSIARHSLGLAEPPRPSRIHTVSVPF